MKAKWIALLARRICNGAIENPDNRVPWCKTNYRAIIFPNFVYNCEVTISFDVIPYSFCWLAISNQEFCRKLELTETRMQNRTLRESWKKNADDLTRREFKSRYAYIKKQESDLLIRWIAASCSIRREEKISPEEKKRGDWDSAYSWPDTSQVIVFWFSLKSCIMSTMPRCTETI